MTHELLQHKCFLSQSEYELIKNISASISMLTHGFTRADVDATLEKFRDQLLESSQDSGEIITAFSSLMWAVCRVHDGKTEVQK